MTQSGARFMELADLYMDQFPLDTSYTVKEFDRWAYSLPEEYRLPKIALRHGDRGWGTHLQNRHNLKERINKGGRCSERDPTEMFQISVDPSGWATKRLAAMTLERTSNLAERMSRTAKTRFKYINTLINSSQFGQLSRGTQVTFENIYIEHERATRWFNFLMADLTNLTNNAYAKARAEIRRLRADGGDSAEIDALDATLAMLRAQPRLLAPAAAFERGSLAIKLRPIKKARAEESEDD